MRFLRAASRPAGNRPGLLRRFLRQNRGVTAIEFGFVALPFFAIIGAIIETAMAFWCTQIMENALGDAARQIYTGQFQQNAQLTNTNATTGVTTPKSNAEILEMIRQRLCKVNGDINGGNRTTIFTCSDVKVDVQVVTQFGDTITRPVTSGNWSSGFGGNWTKPAPNSTVIVQAAVAFPIFFTLLNPSQSSFTAGSDRGKRLIQATVAFRTEPYL